jgi:nucleoid DNA-binding protein
MKKNFEHIISKLQQGSFMSFGSFSCQPRGGRSGINGDMEV